MGVQQRLMALGDWSVTLRDDAPLTLRRSLTTPFAHIVITGSVVDASRVSDAAMLAGSLFTGVVLSPGPQLELAGVDLGWWLGDADGNGPGVIDPAISFNLAPFETVMPGLLPSSLVAGSIQTYGLQHVATYQYVSRREAIDAACAAFGGLEWRINPDFTFDAGTASFIYGTTPVAVAARDTSPDDDFGLVGLGDGIGYKGSWEGWASHVLLMSRAGPVQSGGTSSYRDGRGNLVRVTKIVDGGQVAPGNESTAVSAALTTAGIVHEEVSITSDAYAIAGRVDVGKYIDVYDPVLGLVDTSNQVTFQGRRIFPVARRVFGMRWPVVEGMGVYYRTHNGTSASYVDLTPYVAWESGTTQLDIAWTPLSLTGPA